MSSIKELRAMMKEKASEGDDLAKAVQEKFGDRPDSLLLRFIHARKFDVTRAHELMKGKVLYFIITRRLHCFPAKPCNCGHPNMLLSLHPQTCSSLGQGQNLCFNWGFTETFKETLCAQIGQVLFLKGAENRQTGWALMFCVFHTI